MDSCHIQSVMTDSALEDAGVCQLTTLRSRTNEDANYQGSSGVVSGFHLDNVNLYAWRTPRKQSVCPEVLSLMPGSAET